MNMIQAQELLQSHLRALEIDLESAVEVPFALRLLAAPLVDDPILHIDQALAEGKVEVRELETPTVEKLEVQNLCDARILITPFTLLQGGGQNRTVIKPAIVAPGSSVVVDVHCVQMGRWNPCSRGGFHRSESAPMAFKLRSMKAFESRARRARTDAFSQSATWGRVARSLTERGARSRTSDLMDEVETYRPLEVPDSDSAAGLLSQVNADGWTLESSSKPGLARAVRKALAASLGSLRSSHGEPPAGRRLDAQFDNARKAVLEHGKWDIHPVTGGWHAVLAEDPRLHHVIGQAVLDETGVLWLSLNAAPELADDDAPRSRRRRDRRPSRSPTGIQRIVDVVTEVRGLLSREVIDAYPATDHLSDVLRRLRARRRHDPGAGRDEVRRVPRAIIRQCAFELARRRMRQREDAE